MSRIQKGVIIIFVLVIFFGMVGTANALTTVTDCNQALDTLGETYQLDRDISSTGSCLSYGADNVILDLNGYTITFDTSNTGGSNGIYASGYDNLLLTSSNGGGKIIQDTSCPRSITDCSGDRAIRFRNGEGSTIENIYVGVQGYDTHGIIISGGSQTSTFFNIINNTVNHSGTHLSSRGGFTSMPIKIDKVFFPMNISYNSIIDSPHGGIAVDNNAAGHTGAMDGSDFSYNYMDIDDAYYANPTGILFYRTHAVNIHHNTFVGDGMEGIQFDNFDYVGDARASIHDNFLNLSTIRWPRGQSAGPGSMQGIRIRYNPRNLDIYNNHVIGRATVGPYDEQSSAFGLWMDCRQSGNDCTDVKIWNNTFEAYTDGNPSGGYGAGGIGHAVGVAFTGIGPVSDIEFYNNTIRSNSEVLVFYDGVLNDMNGLQFHDNSLEIVSGTTYLPRTIYGGWIENPPMSIVLRDTMFYGTADKNDFGFERSSDSLTYEWSFSAIVTEDGGAVTGLANLTIVDNESTIIYDGTTSNGIFSTQYLKEWTATTSGTTNDYSPYIMTVKYGGQTIVREVVMDSSKTETFDFILGPCVDASTRQCGVSNIGACTLGTETCTGGVWVGCTAVLSITEICANTIDDDCDTYTDYDDTDDCTTPTCSLINDVYPCDVIDSGELATTISDWYSGQIGISQLMTVIKAWKNS